MHGTVHLSNFSLYRKTPLSGDTVWSMASYGVAPPPAGGDLCSLPPLGVDIISPSDVHPTSYPKEKEQTWWNVQYPAPETVNG